MIMFIILSTLMAATPNDKESSYNDLTPKEEQVIIHKGTERPWTGKYVKHDKEGVYLCKRCDAQLFRSNDKFDSHCGWPSFDDAIKGAVKKQPDADGRRTEIVCANCGAHLGHVFYGEGFTPKNTRHCVNSISLNFLADREKKESKQEMNTAIFAGGCFWGVEYHFEKLDGVKSVVSGYTGGHVKNPTYKQVCTGETGHAEAVKVEYDPAKVTYEELAKLFFEIHDPTQVNRQGPDVGEQYRSAVFYQDEEQKKIAEKLVSILEDKGYDVATNVEPATEFYEAENYHQDYYEKKGSKPYCHFYTERF